MRITAAKIANWATTKEAQASLPRLVRRLVHAAGNPGQASFPAGESTALPGWDGELQIENGNAWVPGGKSFWEFSCDGQVTKKANADYKKRTLQTSKTIRSKATLVVATARKWSQKAKWLKEKRRAKQWVEIRAYDADDLEQWLEESPAVALQFAEELGLRGPGVESLEKHWADWADQSQPAITSEAFFIDRQNTLDRFVADLQRRLKTGQPETITVKADSVEEAAAFVCAALLVHPQISATSLAVTSSNGWDYVAQNLSLTVAVAARPEFAEKPTRRKGLIVIISHATGDMAGSYRGTAGRDGKADLTIERPRISEFERALRLIGLDEADSNRLAVSTGRSWSVFRRRRATNLAIRKPVWCGDPQARALSTLCLLGGWSADKPADREIVAQISGRPYEEVERDLRYLAQVDDAPVLQIGEVWKAKSPLELLDLFGNQITRDELDRFFKIATLILSTPDPQLDLPDQERHAAQIYGKVRAESTLLIETLCDALIKLAVRGPHVPALASASIEERVAVLVRELLLDVDGIRWLSLASFLPDLAEAAPEVFMEAVEANLGKADAPVTRILTETSDAGMFGRCWHAGLLWALERLAWAPQRLARVSLILARLSKIKIRGNWANSPLGTLVDIYRSWFPQTGASVAQRIEILDTLVAKESDVAFELLHQLVNAGPDSATHNARPTWRDDDAGAGYGVIESERHQILVAAADRLILCATGHAQRTARLIEKLAMFDSNRVNSTLALADQFTKPEVSDEDREVVRSALRKHIHWHRNYDEMRGKALDEKLKPIENVHHRLTPVDLVIRYRWLFIDGWPDLPAHVRDGGFGKRGELRETWRENALREIHKERGLLGIEQLATACAPESHYIGFTLPKLNIGVEELVAWIVEKGGEFTPNEPLTNTIWGLLRTLSSTLTGEIINSVLEKGRKNDWEPARIARFMVQAPFQRTTWKVIASCGTEVESLYWSTVSPDIRSNSEKDDYEFFLRRLLEAGRPRTALKACHFYMEKVESHLLADLLEHFLKGEESNGPLPDSWSLGEAVDALEDSGVIETQRLVQLEFGFIPALGYEGEKHAKSLYDAMLSDPKLFVDLLCFLYKPEKGERTEAPSESQKAAAGIAWRLLHHCKRLPGSKRDGTFDPQAFVVFIQETRRLAGEADRLAVCDINLGEVLAHSPVGADGIWPFKPARDVLDRPELEDMRRGFRTGTMNKRGVTWRSPEDGGSQERDLAKDYRKHARTLQNSHVNLAAAIEEIARSYERYGDREDLEAQLRREGH